MRPLQVSVAALPVLEKHTVPAPYFCGKAPSTAALMTPRALGFPPSPLVVGPQTPSQNIETKEPPSFLMGGWTVETQH